MERKFGFTIAELLVTLLIVMVVATAMVPVIGPRKIITHKQKMVHGTFECWRDNNGNLHAFTSNNTNNKDGQGIQVQGDHCVFNPPPANFYSVRVVGAGGNGGGLAASEVRQVGYTLSPGTFNTRWSLPVLGGYQNAISSLPEEVKNALRNYSGSGFDITYTMTSANGGLGKDCVKGMLLSDYGLRGGAYFVHDEGQYENVYTGGNGGAAIVATFKKRINFNTKINVANNSDLLSLNFNNSNSDNHTYTASAAGQGSDAQCTYYDNQGVIHELETPSNGIDSSVNSIFKLDNTEITSSTPGWSQSSGNYVRVDDSLGERTASSGSITASPASLIIERQNPEVRFTYGTSGTNGGDQNVTYTNLDNQVLNLYPASPIPNANGQLLPSRIESVKGNSRNTIYTVNSGSNGTIITSAPIVLDHQSDSFPADLRKRAIAEIVNKDSVNEIIKVKSGMGNFIPGQAGSGAYPMLIDGSVSAGLRINNNGSHISIGTSNFKVNENQSVDNLRCYDSGQTLQRQNNQYYCSAGSGSGGAIKITW